MNRLGRRKHAVLSGTPGSATASSSLAITRKPSYNDPALLGVKLASSIESTRLMQIQPDTSPARLHVYHIQVTPVQHSVVRVFSVPSAVAHQRKNSTASSESLERAPDSLWKLSGSVISSSTAASSAPAATFAHSGASNREPFIVRRTFSDLYDFDAALRKLLQRREPHFVSPIAELAGRDFPIDPASAAYRAREREVRMYLQNLCFLPMWVLEHELVRGFFGVWPADMIANATMKKQESSRPIHSHGSGSTTPTIVHSHTTIAEECEDDAAASGGRSNVIAPSDDPDEDYERIILARLRSTLTKSELVNSWEARGLGSQQKTTISQRRATYNPIAHQQCQDRQFESAICTSAPETWDIVDRLITRSISPVQQAPTIEPSKSTTSLTSGFLKPPKSSKRSFRPVSYNPQPRISAEMMARTSRESGRISARSSATSDEIAHIMQPKSPASVAGSVGAAWSSMGMGARSEAMSDAMSFYAQELPSDGEDQATVTTMHGGSKSDKTRSWVPLHLRTTSAGRHSTSAAPDDLGSSMDGSAYESSNVSEPILSSSKFRTVLQNFSFGGGGGLFRRNSTRQLRRGSPSNVPDVIPESASFTHPRASPRSSQRSSMSSSSARDVEASNRISAILDNTSPPRAQYTTGRLRKVRSSTVNSGSSSALFGPGYGVRYGQTSLPLNSMLDDTLARVLQPALGAEYFASSPGIMAESSTEKDITLSPLPTPIPDKRDKSLSVASAASSGTPSSLGASVDPRPQTAPQASPYFSEAIHFRVIVERGEHITVRLTRPEVSIKALQCAAIRKWTAIGRSGPEPDSAISDLATRMFVTKSEADGMVSRVRADTELWRLVQEEESKLANEQSCTGNRDSAHDRGALPSSAVVTITLYWV